MMPVLIREHNRGNACWGDLAILVEQEVPETGWVVQVALGALISSAHVHGFDTIDDLED
jgi:hypothetical protein